jgi:hypothetical protein
VRLWRGRDGGRDGMARNGRTNGTKGYRYAKTAG